MGEPSHLAKSRARFTIYRDFWNENDDVTHETRCEALEKCQRDLMHAALDARDEIDRRQWWQNCHRDLMHEMDESEREEWFAFPSLSAMESHVEALRKLGCPMVEKG